MNRIFQSRSNLLAVFLALAALVWLSTGSGLKSGNVHYNVPEVDFIQAKALIEAGAMVIDVRGQSQFGFRHLPGAVMIPLESLRTGIPTSLTSIKTKSIVIYCNEGRAHGPEATHLLQQAGFTNVVNLKSGIEGWSSAGLPVVKG